MKKITIETPYTEVLSADDETYDLDHKSEEEADNVQYSHTSW